MKISYFQVNIWVLRFCLKLIMCLFLCFILDVLNGQGIDTTTALVEKIIAFQIDQNEYSKEQPQYYLASVYLEKYNPLDSVFAGVDTASPEFILSQIIAHSRKGDLLDADQKWERLWQHQISDGPFRTLIYLEFAAHLVRKNHFNRADSVYRSILNSVDAIGIESRILKALTFEQKGLLEFLKSDYDSSVLYLDQAGAYWESWHDPHPWKVNYWNHYGQTLTAMGKYDDAEQALQKAIQTAENQNQGFVIPLADATSNLGNLYRLLGDFPKSLNHYKRAKEMYASLGLYIEYATVLNNMGIVYDELDSIPLAIDLLDESASIYEKRLGTGNQAYATLLNNLAGLLDYQEDYERAIEYYQKAIAAIAELSGKDNIYYTTMINNLALTFENTAQPEKAEPLYLEALSIREKVMGKQHPLYAELLYNTASLYSYFQPEKSIPLFKQSNELELRLMKYYYSNFDEATRINYLDDIQIAFEKYFALAVKTRDDSVKIDLTNFSIATKGLASTYSRDIRKQVFSTDKDVISLFNTWQLMRDSLARIMVMNTAERDTKNISVDQFIQSVDQLEKDWTRRTGYGNPSAMTYNQLVKTLEPNEIIIDIIHFENFSEGEWTDTILYYALIIDPNRTAPEIVKLCSEEYIRRILDQHGTGIQSQLDLLSNTLIIPILPYLTHKAIVHFAPSGILHRVPFTGLSIDDKFMIKGLQVYVHAHLRDFLPVELNPERAKSALLVGGLSFGESIKSLNAFAPLAGAEEEVRSVASKLSARDWKVLTFYEDKASRSAIIEAMQSSSYPILHFATHGFSYNYIDNPNQREASLRNRLITSTNPLLRTGLVLSDVNRYWNDPHLPNMDEAAILTAFDIANLQLASTDLVVLSSCESGQGDIHSKEGVFGLPRSFRLAGAKLVIYTLWRIDDKISNRFMQHFYSYFLRNGDARKAFRKAQIKMSRKYDPYYWSGFVLLS